jgi:hypothetical protein
VCGSRHSFVLLLVWFSVDTLYLCLFVLCTLVYMFMCILFYCCFRVYVILYCLCAIIGNGNLMLMSQFSQCGYRFLPLDYPESSRNSTNTNHSRNNSTWSQVGGAVVSTTKKQYKDSNASRSSTHFDQRLVIGKNRRSYPVVLKGQGSSSSSIPRQQRPDEWWPELHIGKIHNDISAYMENLHMNKMITSWVF